MKARANAIFISSIYNQEVIDTNWNEYQTIITANNVNELGVRSSDTTSNSLSVTSGYSGLSQGSKIYVSNNNTTLVGGIIGAITNGTVKSNTSIKVIDAARSGNTGNTIYTAGGSAYGVACFIKPDGRLLWMCSESGVIKEYRLSVPWNPASGAATGKSIQPPGSQSYRTAFCFSYDGRYLYRVSKEYSSPVIGVNRYTLSTPWDISTISVKYDHRQIGMDTTYEYNNISMRISRDGRTLLIGGYSAQMPIYKNTLANPFDITSYITYTGFTFTGIPNLNGNYEISEDGKTWWFWGFSSLTQHYLYQGSFGTAWDPSTMALSKTIPLNLTSQYVSNNASYPPAGFISADGKTTFLIFLNNGTGFTTYNLDTQGGDAAMSYNIDISGFNMSAAPTRAWLSEPNTYVSLTRTANNLYSYPYQIDLDTDTPANTTQAVVGIDGTNVLAAGDTVLLNGTTTVTLTSVTETANGLGWKNPAGTTDYIRYYGKNFQTALTTTQTDTQYILANMHMRISNNGMYVYLVIDANNGSPYGQGLYQYVLTTPWDISTARLNDYLNISAYSFAGGYNYQHYNSNYTWMSGFDMDPNGRRFFIIWGTTYATTQVYQYNLAVPHNINSISSVNGPYAYNGYFTGAASARISGARFNRTGTQIWVKNDYSSGAAFPYYTQYLTLTTPYDITTVSNWATPQTFTGASPGGGMSIDGCFTPEGNYFLCLGQSMADSYLTTQPVTGANNSWTNGFIWNTKSTASSNVADYPANTITASTITARGMDISPDGTKLYIITKSGQIFQFATRLKTLNKYVITYPTQASAPTSVYLPDSSVLQTLTPTLDGTNNTISWTGTNVSANGRAVQFKLTNAPVDTEVTQVRINLKKSQ